MTAVDSFRSIVDLWPSRTALAAQALGNASLAGKVSKWWQRDFIPAAYWSAIVRLRLARRAGVTLELLARLAAARVGEAA